MSKSNTTENDILKVMLTGVDPSWRSGGTIYLALYSTDPGETGTAITNETGYTDYARQPITKATGWTDGGSTLTNADIITFPQCGVTGDTINYAGLVTTTSGAGQLIISGQLVSPLTVSSGIRPQFAVGAVSVTED